MKLSKTRLRFFLIIAIIMVAVANLAYYLFLGQPSVRTRADVQEVHLTSTFTKDSRGVVIFRVTGTPTFSFAMQNYILRINFDTNNLEHILTGEPATQYLIGTRAEGLTIDNPNSTVAAQNPNTSGRIIMQGDIYTANGMPLVANVPVDLVELRFQLKPNAQLPTTISVDGTTDENSTQFGKLNPDNSTQTVVASATSSVIPSDVPPTNGPTTPPSPTVEIQEPTITPSPTLTPSPTPTMAANATVLNLKLKLSGVLRKPQNVTSIPVKVSVKQNTDAEAKSTVGDFMVDDNGVWSGSVFFNDLPQGSGYKIFIKGPKHVQKKFCSNNPTETDPGSYHCGAGTITLNKGENDINFSNIALPAGDVPENGVQNGVINAYDLAVVKNIFDRSDEERRQPGSLAIADLNYDQYVDAQDYSLIIFSLSTRLDEED